MALEDRRPVKARSISVFKVLAPWLAKTNVTPNQISVLSVLFSLLLPISFWYFPAGSWLASIVAIVGIQLRLICNLLDGMVAVEGGKKSLLGDVYNEFPDRIADTLILTGVALAAPSDDILLALALAASFFAVMTAYTRVLGAAVGTQHYFSGPMAKQHRMALLTVALVAIPIIKESVPPSSVLKIVLIVICVGCAVTVIRRLVQISSELKSRSPST